VGSLCKPEPDFLGAIEGKVGKISKKGNEGEERVWCDLGEVALWH